MLGPRGGKPKELSAEELAELERKKKEKAEAKKKEAALPANQAQAWLNKLPGDITAAKQAIGKARASANMPKSIKAEYAAIFVKHLKGLEDARAKIEDLQLPGKDVGLLASELRRAADLLHKFRADNKAFLKSADIYVGEASKK